MDFPSEGITFSVRRLVLYLLISAAPVCLGSNVVLTRHSAGPPERLPFPIHEHALLTASLRLELLVASCIVVAALLIGPLTAKLRKSTA